MYVIRESCPSPLGENELIDELGCPFEPLSATQNNISHFNGNTSNWGITSTSKLPHY